jgi:hypothetical protein
VPVWSARAERHSTDLLEAQDAIAIDLVNQLRLQLGQGRRRYETSAAAHHLYLRARQALLTHRGPVNGAVLASFRQVLEQYRSYAPALAAVAAIGVSRSVQFPTPHRPGELDEAREAAERAIELDPLHAESHDAMGLVHARDSRWSEEALAILTRDPDAVYNPQGRGLLGYAYARASYRGTVNGHAFSGRWEMLPAQGARMPSQWVGGAITGMFNDDYTAFEATETLTLGGQRGGTTVYRVTATRASTGTAAKVTWAP